MRKAHERKTTLPAVRCIIKKKKKVNAQMIPKQ